MSDDRRLIEDYLPIADISAEASREKSVRKGHISTLHLWWARRPLVACRAAVYGALVPASQFVPNGASDEKKKSLGRANAAKFIKTLCQYPGSPHTIKEAQQHILKAHAERLTHELQQAAGTVPLSARRTGGEGRGEVGSSAIPAWVAEFNWPADKTTVTVEDILAGLAPRPRVLDMFAGGGAIPLEALRLGCEAYALDLNPVAHIIQLCTLVYPQKFGKPDPNARGMTGPKNAKGETTWGGLAAEVRYWGNWILERVRAEIGDLYPPIPDPESTQANRGGAESEFDEPQSTMGFAQDSQQRLQPRAGFLTPVAYLWTRTVQCKNPTCGATVPLVKQTWLCKKEGRYVALKMVTANGREEAQKSQKETDSLAPSAPSAPFGGNPKRVRFEVVEARSATGLGFDPEAFSKAGNATCPFCGTVADAKYVQAEGCGKQIGQQMMAIACTHPKKDGKVYVAADQVGFAIPDEVLVRERIDKLEARCGLTRPREAISPLRPSPNARGLSAVTRHGIVTFGDLFAPRQLLCLLTFAEGAKTASAEIDKEGHEAERAKAVTTFLGAILDRLADFNSSLCVLNYTGGRGVGHTFTRHALPMVWDFAETNPFNPDGASWVAGVADVPEGLRDADMPRAASAQRGSAIALSFDDSSIDAVITDPPYYDNVPYADVSDFFYVWLKRTVGHIYPDHFASELTPKRAEATALSSRHAGDMPAAEKEYEALMSKAFTEAGRVLKPGGPMGVVYAHKTTLGWSTLVDALRKTGFTVTEAWPLDTEKRGRMLAQDTAALASSIFLVARKREGTPTGYEEQVRPELEEIVRERVETLWDMGISGADLVIASVGAGLRAFTRFARVEYANGEEVPAERFLTEVETVVLETILARLSKEVGGKGSRTSLAGLDAATRFYILWRYTYGAAELDAGEAIIFANGTHVELAGQHGLTGGSDALVEKKKSKYRLRDFAERGENDALGLPSDGGQSAPLVDTLHRALWLMEKRPAGLAAFLAEAQPNREQLRLVAQALAGPALKGGELGDISPTAELSALGKLTANWQSVIEDAALTTGQKEERRTGQKQLM